MKTNRYALWLLRVRHAHFYNRDFSTKVERAKGWNFLNKIEDLREPDYFPSHKTLWSLKVSDVIFQHELQYYLLFLFPLVFVIVSCRHSLNPKISAILMLNFFLIVLIYRPILVPNSFQSNLANGIVAMTLEQRGFLSQIL